MNTFGHPLYFLSRNHGEHQEAHGQFANRKNVVVPFLLLIISICYSKEEEEEEETAALSAGRRGGGGGEQVELTQQHCDGCDKEQTF